MKESLFGVGEFISADPVTFFKLTEHENLPGCPI